MKYNRLFHTVFVSLGMAALIALASCSDEHHSGVDRGTAVTFSPSISASGVTRALDDTWTDGDKVGIAMYTETALPSDAPFAEYSVSVSGSSAGLSSSDPLYYPIDGTEVRFMAFSPYAEPSDNRVILTGFDDQSTLDKANAVDFLYHSAANDTYDKDSQGAVSLTFAHKLSKLKINLITTTDNVASQVDLEEITGISVSDLPNAATIDLSDGTVTAGVGSTATSLYHTDDAVNYTYQAIVVPHTAKQGRKVTISIGAEGGSFEASLADDMAFDSGMIYTLNYRLTRKGLELVGAPTIEDWATGTITWDAYQWDIDGNPDFSTTPLDVNGQDNNTITFSTTYPGNQVNARVDYGSGEQGWITLSTNDGFTDGIKKGDITNDAIGYTCMFSVLDNSAVGNPKRSASVLLTVDRVEKSFQVTQDGNGTVTVTAATSSFSFSPDIQQDNTFSFNTDYQGTGISVQLSTSDTDYNAGAPDWITPKADTPLSGTYTNYTYTYSLVANTGESAAIRTAYAHVMVNGVSVHTFAIAQQPVTIKELSTISALSAEGVNNTSFTFKTNYTDVDATATLGDSWLTLSTPSKSSADGEGYVKYTYTLSAPHNITSGGDSRSDNITITSDVVAQTVPVSQSGAKGEPASNSYMLKPNTTIYIPVSRANEHNSGAIGATDELSTDLYWMSASKLLTKLDVIGTGKDAYIKVTANSTPSTGGNAHIGLAKKGADIKAAALWSWHIWVVESSFNPSTTKGTFMDRNLGATSAAAGNVGTIGLYYQWGRKDPFPTPKDFSGTEPTIYKTLTGAGTTYAVPSPLIETGTPSSMVSTPEKFYKVYDGAATGDKWDLATHNPCPAGWTVPVNGTWTGSAGSGWLGALTNNGQSNSSFGGYYPAAGRRGTTDGTLGGVGAYGCYWSATPHESATSTAYYLSFIDSNVSPSGNLSRASGFGVRCVAE